MVNTSKILTVSYGTFSCTLEGFDDSFDTMKAIAEYFRDLAADDRYFGAEPPTPDAEMLARIAEREISRRVDAHEQEGNIVLRAAQDAALTASAETQGETPPEREPDEQATQEAPTEKESVPDTAATEEPQAEFSPEETPQATTETAEHEAEDQAEPARIEAPVADQTAETEPDSAISGVMTDAVGKDDEQADLEAEPTQPASEPEAVAEPEPKDDQATVATDDAAPVAEFDDVAETETKTEAADDTQSVADRLRRIRSLVDGSETGFQDTAYSEDEHAQDFLSETAADLDEVLSAEDAAESVAQDEVDEPDLSSVLDAFDTQAPEPAPKAEAVEDTTKQEPAPVEIAEDTLAQLLADAMPEDHDAEAPTPAAEDEASVDEDSEERPAIQARVVKMKRSEFEAAISDGYIEEDTDESLDDNLFGDDSGLSAEEEADLQRELAQVEAEFGASDAPEAPETAEDDSAPLRLTAAEQVQHTTEAEAPESAEAADENDAPDAEGADDETSARGISKLQRAERQADLARIFDETDTQLDAPETNKRRSAIQHLRAAVAATRAEKKAGTTLKEDVDDSPYRSDLANVVRPRRPEATGEGRARVSRPNVTSSTPAPLTLVAEQRVDVESAPVRPRRVSTAQLTAQEASASKADDSSSFIEFAEEMGAHGLPELLEAAAAYMSDVEGRSQFSRPMLMGKLKEVEGRDFSREDGLRTFGQLLRQGKLQKLKGGRFCVTDHTDFRAETRNAG